MIKFNLYAVYGLAHAFFRGKDQFTIPLPVEVSEGVTLENVSNLILPGSFDIFTKSIADRGESLDTCTK